MSRFKELRRAEFEKFLQAFSRPGSLKFRNNKWIGLNREGKPFTVHVRHGKGTEFPPPLVEAVARDLGVTLEEFLAWYERRR
ncbi:MAG: hypothetical protein D9V47_14955 [Clostridia bacterium]|nr:MAG: hypothetical protein D9V47_14955 [Clostridia bacterium]